MDNKELDVSIVKMIHDLIEKEGGYSNDPNDSGGETMYGVTVFEARSFGYEGEMKEMPYDVAFQIYLSRFWTSPQFDRVYSVSESISLELFDTGVNMGTGIAAGFLQRALNVLNQQGTKFQDLTVDGRIGELTIYCLKAYLKDRGRVGESTLLKMLNALQSVRYIELAEKRPKDEKYEFGWQTNRVEV